MTPDARRTAAPAILLATSNPGKVREIEPLLNRLGLGLRLPESLKVPPEVVEDGATFSDNARIKSRAFAIASGLWSLADDSGLEVDALGGRPGVGSARYAGPNATDRARCEKLLEEMEGVEPSERTARFRCVMILSAPDGQEFVTEGALEGTILPVARGWNGFGYDPVFVPLGAERTLAEMELEEKNRISHRGQALRAMRSYLEQVAARLRRGHSIADSLPR